MMVLWVLIIGGLLYFLFKENVILPTTKKPLTRIKERLAEGEITLEEYNRLKRILEE